MPAIRHSSAGALEVQVAIPGHGSLIVATTSKAAGRRFPTFEPAGPSIDVRGPWQIRFAAGGPDRPRDRELERLRSWTVFDGDDVKRFSGTAIYQTTFERPARSAAAWLLDLGRVHDSARVVLNGRDLGTLIGPAFRLMLDPSDLAAANVLEIHVSNLMANRIAALDKGRRALAEVLQRQLPGALSGQPWIRRAVQRRRVGATGFGTARSGDAHPAGVSEVIPWSGRLRVSTFLTAPAVSLFRSVAPRFR